MSDHDVPEDAELPARQRTAYVAGPLTTLLAAFDAARPADWRDTLPGPFWARPWSEADSPTLVYLMGGGR